MVDRSQYKVGIVTSIVPCASANASSKKLRACQVKISENDDDATITVVTAATNVREGSRYA
jgi:tRNA-binding EMAP/Myf-like protein